MKKITFNALLNHKAQNYSELLGHADAAITLNRYVHSSMEMKKNYVERLSLMV